jgi:hypothetical protein
MLPTCGGEGGPTPPETPAPTSKGSSNRAKEIAGGVAAGVFAVAVIIVVIISGLRRREARPEGNDDRAMTDVPLLTASRAEELAK